MSRVFLKQNFPKRLLEIPHVPEKLYIEGEFPQEEDVKFLAVVGSRKHTNYGKDACEKLIAGLKGYPIVIVSGLALGIDAIAHKAALENGLRTIAIPGSGLDRSIIHPQTNAELADRIVRNDGCLISEYEPTFRATQWSFPQRNRIMAGMCSAVLVIEAEEKSGTLITARMATDYNRDVLALPGSIFSKSSNGTNMLIRMGATPIRHANDLLEALGFEAKEDQQAKTNDADLTKEEKKMLDLLDEPMHKDELIRQSGFPTVEANIILSMMEIKGLVKEEMGEIRKY
jgi:DNA processing protein